MTAELRAPALRWLFRRLDGPAAPLPLYRALSDDGRAAHTMLLEFGRHDGGASRRSMLVLSSALSITCEGEQVSVTALNATGAALLPPLARRLGRAEADDESLRLILPVAPRAPADTDAERLRAPSPLHVLRELIGLLQPGLAGVPECVFLAGMVAYDLVERFEGLPDPADPTREVPDFRFYLADRLVIVDHARRSTEVIATVLERDQAGAEAARADMARVIDLAAALGPSDEIGDRDGADDPPPAGTPDCGDADFAARVAHLQAHITAGDVFQVVPSRAFSLPCPDPLAAYQCLRRREPAPYLFYANAGEFTLFGASPEAALSVDGPTRAIEISPIAGTRARGRSGDGQLDAELDALLEVELLLDPKEQAEHLMLVDLARNDVARVSRAGTRHVTQLLRVERYAHVMHLVSRVRGELAEGLDALHAAQAVLPMGTLTGAPKHRAMELLRVHEPGRRGMYGGAIGYLTADLSLDSAIVIRAALVRDGVARVRAGAGVVQDSVPGCEADETRRKAEAVLRAIVEASQREAAHVA